MEITITVAGGAKAAALTKAMDAYNASHFQSQLSPQQFLQKLVDGQLDALVRSYVVTTVSRLAFMQRFTADERVAIRTAAQSSPAVQDYLELLNVSEQIDLTHTLTVTGVQQMETAGLLAVGRSAEILAL